MRCICESTASSGSGGGNRRSPGGRGCGARWRDYRKAYNHVETDRNSSGHAEMLAIREAERVLGSKWLTGCELYVTLEPCAMCAGAMVLARLDRLWIGAMDPKNGACGSVFNVVQEERLNHRMEVETGILEAECGQILVGLLSEHARGEGTEAKTFPAENDIAGQY